MTDAAGQLPFFLGCPYDGCEEGYCACLEQDVDDELLAELLAELYGDSEFEEPDEEMRKALADLMAGRAVIHRGRIRGLTTLPDIAAYTSEGTHL